VASREDLGGAKITEVVVVAEYIYWQLGAFNVGAPYLKGFNDGEKLFIVDFIV
jgi:hypothetical protein